MINHVRTVLLNEVVPSIYDDSDEYIPTGFSPIVIPDSLKQTYNKLFGNSNRLSKNHTLAQILTIADRSSSIYAIVRRRDYRITYSIENYSFTEAANDWILAASEIDPDSVFRQSGSDDDQVLYNVWLNAPVEADKSAAVAIALALRLIEYRDRKGLDEGAF